MFKDKTLTIIVLIGVILGMFLTVPGLFLADVVVAGIICGFLFGVVGYFIRRNKNEENSVNDQG